MTLCLFLICVIYVSSFCTMYFSADNQLFLDTAKGIANRKKGDTIENPTREEDDRSPFENGELRSNGMAETKSVKNAGSLTAIDGNRSKSRFSILLIPQKSFLCAYCTFHFENQCFI